CTGFGSRRTGKRGPAVELLKSGDERRFRFAQVAQLAGEKLPGTLALRRARHQVFKFAVRGGQLPAQRLGIGRQGFDQLLRRGNVLSRILNRKGQLLGSRSLDTERVAFREQSASRSQLLQLRELGTNDLELLRLFRLAASIVKLPLDLAEHVAHARPAF